MTSSNGTSSTTATEETLDEIGRASESKKHKSRAALYTDVERLRIIEEIYKRTFLWTNESKDAMNVPPAVRRQVFAEIAENVSSSTGTMKAEDIERQWKNLKDTYVKIRKKNPPTENGNQSSIRWRFYRLLQFIDPDKKVTRSFDFEKELAAVQNEQRKPETSKLSNSSSSNTSPASNPPQFNNHVAAATQANGVRYMAPNLLTHTVIPQPLPSNSPLTRLKRSQDSQSSYVRHPIGAQNHSQATASPNHNDSTPNPHKEPRIAPPNTNGVFSLSVHEDEYVSFCSSLVHPIREIANHDKMEYLKLQKIIHDALFDIQSRIHSSNNGATTNSTVT
ncbi:MADF domain-containing protein [Aphelenchoides bicaudatus]|nr:MADF domain-containing protein [Aphelenchoides bicaudatus]